MRLRGTIAWLLILFTAASFAAQTSRPSTTTLTVRGDSDHRAPDEGRLKSDLMGRDMPYRVVLPLAYSTRTADRFPVLYLLHGLTGNYKNWTDLTRIRSYAEAHNLIIVTPEGENGWYTDSTSRASDKYESYIVKELIPEVEKKYRVIASRDKRAIAGLSMGGYGALKFGLKYPEKFVLAGSFSGALGAASITEAQFPGAVGKTIDGIFGPSGNEARKGNDLFHIVREASPEKIKSMPFLYVDCGTEDFLFQNNREFVSLLVEKKVPHEYRQLPGAHNWAFWDKQVLEFLRLADRTFSLIETKPGAVQK
ncbi:MAG TPA: alpha/beta hydrolase family protein [Pyrinomonadaceae bacterium]|nr:alpha/beta hydrolase family protein [Pyrinomonadaceae bacterium]